MQGTGERFETIFTARLIFGDLIRAFDAVSHKIADTLKTCPQPRRVLREIDRSQCSILPLEIIFRRTYETENTFDGPVDKRIGDNLDQFVPFLCILPKSLFLADVAVSTGLVVGMPHKSGY